MTAIPVPRIVPADVGTLERRARELSAPAAADPQDGTAPLLPLVTFRLRAVACAVETAVVERAVVLARPLAVPAEGSERHVAFVLERPLRVADLAAFAAGIRRGPAELDGAPALVIGTAAGPVAVAVEGPIDLAEDAVAARSDGSAEVDAIRFSGRLGGGALLVDPAWLAAWAAGVER